MRSHYILLMAAMLSALYINSQNLVWARTMGGTNYTEGRAIAVDASGNVYVASSFNGTTDFDPGAGTFDVMCGVGFDMDATLTKLDAAGHFVWAKTITGSYTQHIFDVKLDDIGNIYLTGTLRDSCDLDPGPGVHQAISNGAQDVFIVKLDNDGNFIWGESYGSPAPELPRQVLVDASGNVIVTGSFYHTCDFDPSTDGTFEMSTDIWSGYVLKLDADGAFMWAKSFDSLSPSVSSVYSAALDAAGNIIITGTFTHQPDFDPGSAVFPIPETFQQNIFVDKLDNDGNFLWVQWFSSAGPVDPLSVAVDASADIYITGYFHDDIDLDSGPGENTLIGNFTDEAFLIKINADGTLQWGKKFGGPGSDKAWDVCTGNDGAVFVTGTFEATADFDPGTGNVNRTSTGMADVFITRFDAEGDIVWARSVGGQEEDGADAIVADEDNNAYTTGFFKLTADLDPSVGGLPVAASGEQDAFVLKLDNGITGIEETQNNAFSIYPIPAYDVINISYNPFIGQRPYSIMDAAGRIIARGKITGNTNTVDVKSLAPGLYFLQIDGEGCEKVLKR